VFIARLFIGMIVVVQTGLLIAADLKVEIRFQAKVGAEDLACGHFYAGIGTTKSTIQPRDFRFYVHNLRLIDESGKEVALLLEQDGKWQLDDLALLDFENATGACSNGTPELNERVVATAPGGHTYRGLKFVLGVPFEKNHTDLTTMPPPLNLTAMAWVWNAGRKFARLDFSSTGLPRGFAIHLGSTGCTPDTTATTVPTTCREPNRAEIVLPDFDPAQSVVVGDLAALLKNSDVDHNQPKTASGCMSGTTDADCGPLFANLGLPFPGQQAKKQAFFRSELGTGKP
jgi:uncharacterized repeat protein (TIGR04052 family)